MSKFLVADIGGTHARCAVAQPVADAATYALANIAVYRCSEFSNVSAMLHKYRTDLATDLPGDACLAVAGPVRGDRITLTNNDWNFSVEQLRRRFQFNHLTVINDLAAVAYATRHIVPADLLELRPGRPPADATRVVIGSGTGLGVSALSLSDGQWRSVASEAGHAAFVPAGALQQQVHQILMARHDHVSWESILSGPGLLEAYSAVAEASGLPVARLRPRDITAGVDNDPLCNQTVDIFCDALARFAGDAVLWFCGFGGVYLSGHICGSLRSRLCSEQFLARFTDKGVVTPMLKNVPLHLMVNEHPGLIGAAAHAHRQQRRERAAAVAR